MIDTNELLAAYEEALAYYANGFQKISAESQIDRDANQYGPMFSQFDTTKYKDKWVFKDDQDGGQKAKQALELKKKCSH